MSKQIYTIFCNKSSISIDAAQHKIHDNISLSEFKKYLKKCIANPNQVKKYSIEVSSPLRFLEIIKRELFFIQSAGGIVEQDNQFLYIKRFDKWDLPKGKIEKGENNEEAALREVEEECGVANLKIIKQLPSTYHIYLHYGKPAVKETFWFYMIPKVKIENLVPQEEEGITDVMFKSKDFLLDKSTITYTSLVDLMNKVLKG